MDSGLRRNDEGGMTKQAAPQERRRTPSSATTATQAQ
jgi:hypothetical protein